MLWQQIYSSKQTVSKDTVSLIYYRKPQAYFVLNSTSTTSSNTCNISYFNAHIG